MPKLFSRKSKKNVISLTSAELAQRVVKVKTGSVYSPAIHITIVNKPGKFSFRQYSVLQVQSTVGINIWLPHS